MILYTEGEMAEKLVAQGEIYRAEINKLGLLLDDATKQGFFKGAEWMREKAADTAHKWMTPEQIYHGAGGARKEIMALPLTEDEVK